MSVCSPPFPMRAFARFPVAADAGWGCPRKARALASAHELCARDGVSSCDARRAGFVGSRTGWRAWASKIRAPQAEVSGPDSRCPASTPGMTFQVLTDSLHEHPCRPYHAAEVHGVLGERHRLPRRVIARKLPAAAYRQRCCAAVLPKSRTEMPYRDDALRTVAFTEPAIDNSRYRAFIRPTEKRHLCSHSRSQPKAPCRQRS